MTDEHAPNPSPQMYLIQFANCIKVFGIICFIAPFAYPIFSNSLPASFEWPVGYADNVIRTKQQNYIVPHIPSGRIQVYDANFQFIRGWKIDASEGTFRILAFNEQNQQIEVVTARNHKKYVFSLTGQEIARENYPSGQYDSFPKVGNSIAIPTPIWLFPLSHPFIAVALALIGSLIYKMLSARRTKQR